MRDFESLNDWALLDQQLRNNMRQLHNQQHRRQLLKMHANLYHSVTELSRKEIDSRRTGNYTQYNEQLTKCKQELQELQQWLMFATLIDENPNR